MNYLDFLAEATLHGRLLNTGFGASPQEVAAEFGEPARTPPGGPALRRHDYGLVEFMFSQGYGWTCGHIEIHVRRLAVMGPDMVPARLARACGEFPAHVPFADLEAAVGKRGGTFTVSPDGQHTTKHVLRGDPDADMWVYVMKEDSTDFSRGDVWGISLVRRRPGVTRKRRWLRR